MHDGSFNEGVEVWLAHDSVLHETLSLHVQSPQAGTAIARIFAIGGYHCEALIETTDLGEAWNCSQSEYAGWPNGRRRSSSVGDLLSRVTADGREWFVIAGVGFIDVTPYIDDVPTDPDLPAIPTSMTMGRA